MLGSSATTLTSQHQDKQLLVDLRRKIEKSVQVRVFILKTTESIADDNVLNKYLLYFIVSY